MKTIWRLWAKALGEKATKDDREADHVSYIRTVIFFTYLITNLFIISGVVRHWNDEINNEKSPVSHEVVSPIPRGCR